jgi:hypothetical protein
MWRDIPYDPHNPATWTSPVIRLAGYGGETFRRAANTPILHAAFDQRFPHLDDPGDTGWHVDLSFPGDDCDPNEQHDFSSWRVNVTSSGRALLMLFLFLDIGAGDAPTRIRVGSHMDMARFLEPAGQAGMSHMILDDIGADRPEASATGEAGTVYLCHPFLVHAAQRRRGSAPRFMAQPPLGLAEPYQLRRTDARIRPWRSRSGALCGIAQAMRVRDPERSKRRARKSAAGSDSKSALAARALRAFRTACSISSTSD